MQIPEPQREHQWLQRIVGEWTFENECIMEPGKPPSKFTGTDSVRKLGELWVICEGQGEMPGGGVSKSIMSLGFDPAKKRFVGTFIASPMTFLWVYDGGLQGNVLTMDCDGPSFTGQGMAKYQDIIEIISDDHRTLTSQQLVDGKWQHFMTAHYRRKR
jgi:hypothetical protein